MLLVHGTTVEISGHGVLIRGVPGSGKSDLALRLIDSGAFLIADDQTWLAVGDDGRVIARSPETIAGLIEARGVGILRLPHHPSVPLSLVVDLVTDAGAIERLPEPSSAVLMGVAIPRIDLVPFQASAAAKVRLAVLSPTRDIMAIS
ncbi:HPr kinase/phosphorylase [Magnetospirillum molischianum]|uniref:Serine kinase of the HPr protein, regulates carb ohydrate metabolism n=1 Tax=Magnetospirillum molischianum DSM 120 TaxID=1150626 RepID=H8FPM8_MAGML|nr:aldolase [Magnetospirillum molischianum]CCG40316.1 Serine kinase of the HPr protein, regulates carb ohydrate metabolism [Magnetospirillum molischianum DSM 120]